jgi:hypothetical protein
MLGWRRATSESYVDALRRKTRLARKVFLEMGHISLLIVVLKRIWAVATTAQLPASHRAFRNSLLITNILSWQSAQEFSRIRETALASGTPLPLRYRRISRGKPPVRWEDLLVNTFGLNWHEMVRDGTLTRKHHEAVFLHSALVHLKMNPAAFSLAPKINVLLATSLSGPRTLEQIGKVYIDWETIDSKANGVRVEICGDSSLVCNWLNGTATVKRGDLLPKVSYVRDLLALAWISGVFIPRKGGLAFCRHIPRELNITTDYLSKSGRLGNRIEVFNEYLFRRGNWMFYRVHFDGSLKNGRGGGGFTVHAAENSTITSESMSLQPITELSELDPKKKKMKNSVQIHAIVNYAGYFWRTLVSHSHVTTV